MQTDGQVKNIMPQVVQRTGSRDITNFTVQHTVRRPELACQVFLSGPQSLADFCHTVMARQTEFLHRTLGRKSFKNSLKISANFQDIITFSLNLLLMHARLRYSPLTCSILSASLVFVVSFWIGSGHISVAELIHSSTVARRHILFTLYVPCLKVLF